MTSTTTTKNIVITIHVICAPVSLIKRGSSALTVQYTGNYAQTAANLILALVIITFGSYLACTYNKTAVDGMAAYSYIGIGAAALLVLLFGCFSAVRESVCCTVTFIVLLLIVIIAQLILVFLLTAGQGSVASNFANVLDQTWEEELKNPGAMSLYENWFECCGRASPQDYIFSERLPPVTCFKNRDSSRTENLIENGCRVEFENYCQRLLFIFNMLCWLLIGFEVFGTTLSCYLCNSIRNDQRRTYF